MTEVVPSPNAPRPMADTPESKAMWAATVAARKVLATAKNPRTVLGQMDPTGVAYHAARAAIEAHQGSLGNTANCENR